MFPDRMLTMIKFEFSMARNGGKTVLENSIRFMCDKITSKARDTNFDSTDPYGVLVL